MNLGVDGKVGIVDELKLKLRDLNYGKANAWSTRYIMHHKTWERLAVILGQLHD